MSSNPPPTAAVACDFRADLHAIVQRLLADNGFTVSSTGTLDEHLRQWLQIQHRRVPRRPRAVAWSAELRARAALLPVDEREALRRIEAAVERGDDLNPYLSRQLRTDKAFKKHDGLLNELGVQHMHLGEGRDTHGMVVGTKHLLFVLVDDGTVRFMGIFDHASFGDDRPFLIAESNWPELFRSINIPAQRAEGTRLTPQERATIRAKGGNTVLTTPDGSAYFPPGGGMASSGISLNVVVATDGVLDRLRTIESWCRANGEYLAKQVAARGGSEPSTLRLRFINFDPTGAAVIVDDETGAHFRIEP